MRMTDALRGEHGVFYAWFEQIETMVTKGATTEVLRGHARALAGALGSHADLEDRLLFTALEPKIGPMGPLHVMRHEHEEIEAGIAAMADEQDAGSLADRLSSTNWDDPRSDPPVGQGFYYLVRSQKSCGHGSYGTTSSGSERLLVGACP